jgi:hypothetical protein
VEAWGVVSIADLHSFRTRSDEERMGAEMVCVLDFCMGVTQTGSIRHDFRDWIVASKIAGDA